ncbi:MAG: PAS domain S-box protein [bacterium]|nr:PAS domain S-box protein [bacterium]
MKHRSIKVRVLIPTALVFIFLLVGGIVGFYFYAREHIREDVRNDVTSVESLFRKIIERNTLVLGKAIRHVQADKQLQAAWLSRDRAVLVPRADEFFRSLGSVSDLTHFYFHNPDKTNFLRVHNPGLHGDAIRLSTLKGPAPGSSPQGIIAIGPAGKFVLLVVQPWYIAGEFAGYVEMGIELTRLHSQVFKTMQVDLVLAVDKEYFDRNQWEERQRSLGLAFNWERFKDIVVFLQTVDIPLSKQVFLPASIDNEDISVSRLESMGRTFYGGLLRVPVSGGRKLVNILVLRDVSNVLAGLRELFAVIATAVIFITGILLTFFHFYLGRIENDLVETRENLRVKEEEQQQVKDALLKSEERFRSIVNILGEGISLVDENERFLYINPVGEKILGVGPGELVGRNLGDFLSPKMLQVVDMQTGKRMLGETNSYDFEITRPDGEKRQLTITASPIPGQEGYHGSIGVFRDVTFRNKAEKAVQESEAKFRTLFETSVEGILVADIETKEFMFANPAICQMLGYEEEELIGMGVGNIHPKEALPEVFSEFEAQARGLKTVASGLPVITKDKRVLYVDIKTAVTRLNGKYCNVGFFTDISERLLAEEALKESEEKYRVLFEASVDGILITDIRSGELVFANPAFCSMLGYGEADVLALRMEDLCPDVRSVKECCVFDTAMGTRGLTENIPFQRKGGGVIYMDIKGTNVTVSGRNCSVGFFRDVTLQREAREKLLELKEVAEAANNAKSEFLANMSHEIRTPMNAIIGFANLLESSIIDKKQSEYLKSIKIAGDMLLTLINDILDLSKIEAGQMKIFYEPVNPHPLFTEVQKIFSMKAAGKHLDFVVDIDETLPPRLMLDAVRLRQVMFNVLGNAVKFTEQGHITFSVKQLPAKNESEGIDLEITIEDTGIGIPENQLEVIFESFRQQDGRRNRKYGGTGLGLSISRRLMKMMGGDITVRSRVGEGTAFRILLSGVGITTEPAVTDPLDTGDIRNIRFEKVSALVVDDITSNRELVTELLLKANLDVIQAENGEVAVMLAKKHLPAVIIMDIRMPVMDGFEATRIIKSNPATAGIPVIALTASVTTADMEKIREEKFDGFLDKPLNPDAFFSILCRYLERVPGNGPVPAAASRANLPDKPLYKQEDLGHIFDLKGLLAVLESDLTPQWKRVTKVIEVDAVGDFVKRLIRLAEIHRIDWLTTYAENLNAYARDYDVENTEIQLERFPSIVSALSGAAQQGEEDTDD